jgi:hypothetical protein
MAPPAAAAKIDPMLKKKWERVFYTFFDTNKNKVIDWNDFEVVFEKIKDLRGEDSLEYKIVTDAMLCVWKGLLQETKGKDMIEDYDNTEAGVEITIDEWDKLWQKYDPHHMHIWQWEYLKYMFFLIDTSGDKFIDVNEYAQVMKLYGLDEKSSKAAFAKFALDGHGKPVDKVDYGMFVKLWNEYFCSTDLKKPGSFLFGDW